MIYFEDILEFSVLPSENAQSVSLIIKDYDGVQKTKKLSDLKEELWFISQNKTDMTVVPVSDTAHVVFDHKSTPSCTLPMALIERIKQGNLLVPQAFIQFHIGSFGSEEHFFGVPRFYWSTELPLKDSGKIPIKRIRSIEVTKVIREAGPFQHITEVDLAVEKRNHEMIRDTFCKGFSLNVLSKAGLSSLKLETVHKITFNYTTV